MSYKHSTLKDVFDGIVADTPDKIGFMYLYYGDGELQDESYSYAEMAVRASKILAALHAKGLQAGDKVIFQLPDVMDSIPLVWACWLGGLVIVPLPIPTSYEQANAELGKLHGAVNLMQDKPVVVTRAASMQSIMALKDNEVSDEYEFPGNMQVFDYDDLTVGEPTADTLKHIPQPDDLAALMLTSGSTGNSKAVMLTHKNMTHSHYQKAKTLGFDSSIRTLNWIAADHVANICDGNVLPLICGGIQIHINSSNVVANPLLFIEAIAKYDVTQTFAPNFLFGIINKALSEKNLTFEKKLDISKLEVVLSGGEAVVLTTAKKCIELLKKNFGLRDHVISPGFGMTEICAGSVFNRSFPSAIDEKREFATLGPAMEGLQMRVVSEEDDTELKAGEVGRLQFKGDAVFVGYYKNAEATKKSFPYGLDGWFDTGDLAVLSEDGALSLAGRLKDSIIINGKNYYSHEAEAVIERLDGIVPSFTCGTPVRLKGSNTEELVVFYHNQRALDDDGILYKTFMLIRDEMVQFMGVKPLAIICVPKSVVPKSTLGKVLRKKLRKQFEAGDFKADQDKITELIKLAAGQFVAPKEGSHEGRVRALWANVLGLPEEEISCKINFFDIGGTSLDTIELKVKVDTEFKCEIPAVWIFSYPTIQEFCVKLHSKLERRKYLKSADGSWNHDYANKHYEPMVKFHDGNGSTKPPLFAVHTGAGDVMAYMELSKRVTDRPFYGIKTRGFDEGETMFDDYKFMIREYVKGILSVQADGPYHVCGYSYGAVLCYDVCRVLEEEHGKDVAFCGIIDTPVELRGFGEIPRIDMTVYLVVYLGLVEKKRFRDLLGMVHGKSEEEWIPTLMKAANKKRIAELHMTNETFGFFVRIGYALKHMALQQHTEGRIAALHVFSGYRAEPMMVKSDEWRRQQRMWKNHGRQVNFYNVLGHHETVLEPVGIVAFSRVFLKALEMAELQFNDRQRYRDLGNVPVDECEELQDPFLWNEDRSTIKDMKESFTHRLDDAQANLSEGKVEKVSLKRTVVSTSAASSAKASSSWKVAGVISVTAVAAGLLGFAASHFWGPKKKN